MYMCIYIYVIWVYIYIQYIYIYTVYIYIYSIYIYIYIYSIYIYTVYTHKDHPSCLAVFFDTSHVTPVLKLVQLFQLFIQLRVRSPSFPLGAQKERKKAQAEDTQRAQSELAACPEISEKDNEPVSAKLSWALWYSPHLNETPSTACRSVCLW